MAGASPDGAPATGAIGAVLVVGALTFNAVLAIVNAHVTALTPGVVVASEAFIVGSALLVALRAFRPEMSPWLALMLLLLLFAGFRTLGTGSLDPKALRDGWIIPTFVVLGMTVEARTMLRAVLAVQALVLAFLLLEMLDTPVFAALFEIKSYYMNTRGISEEAFWNTDSTLFVSATRPDERFFLPGLDMHRGSSLFLDPVSLGNHCVVITCVICAAWRRLSWPARLFLIASNVALIVGCDGRLAFLSSLAVIAVAALARFLPPLAEALYVPLALLAGFLATTVGGWKTGTDDLPGRVALTLELLGRFGASDFLGLSSEHLSVAVDSGLVYMIATQTVFGVLAIWSVIVLASSRATLEQVRFLNGACIFMASNFMVSFSFLSIKTAALLWAAHGAIQVGRRRAGAKRPAAPARTAALFGPEPERGGSRPATW